MPVVRLKIDIGGTVGDEAWLELLQFGEIRSAHFGPEFGGSACRHMLGTPHPAGEWRGAAIELSTPLLAQYAVSHYLEQPRVLDADVEP